MHFNNWDYNKGGRPFCHFHATKTLLWIQATFIDRFWWNVVWYLVLTYSTGEIVRRRRRRSSAAAADGLAVSCFLRVSDHLESIWRKILFTENFDYLNFCDDVIHREIFLSSGSQNFQWKKNFANWLQMVWNA